jgi:hypothetical protein
VILCFYPKCILLELLFSFSIFIQRHKNTPRTIEFIDKFQILIKWVKLTIFGWKSFKVYDLGRKGLNIYNFFFLFIFSSPSILMNQKVWNILQCNILDHHNSKFHQYHSLCVPCMIKYDYILWWYYSLPCAFKWHVLNKNSIIQKWSTLIYNHGLATNLCKKCAYFFVDRT